MTSPNSRVYGAKVVVHPDGAIEGIPEQDLILSKSRKLTEALARPIQLSDAKPESFQINGYMTLGGFGCILLATHKCTGRSYAMKVQAGAPDKALFNLNILKSKKRKRIERELKIVLAVDFKFTTKAHYVFEDQHFVYMASQVATYGDLCNAWKYYEYVTEEQTRFVMAQCVLALEYLHCAEVIHRDIKPNNILMYDDGYVKLTDFGLSIQLKKGRAATFAGTPGFLAPEIYFEHQYGKGVDWFSLGATIIFIRNKEPSYDDRPAKRRHLPPTPQLVQRYISPTGRDFIDQLIEAKVERRLGVKAGGSRNVRNHAWFKGMDWEALYAKMYPNPFTDLHEAPIKEDWLNEKKVAAGIKNAFGFRW